MLSLVASIFWEFAFYAIQMAKINDHKFQIGRKFPTRFPADLNLILPYF